MTITIESDSGTRIKLQVDHEPHFDLLSETVDGLRSSVRTVETTVGAPDEGRMCLVLAKLTLDSLLEVLPPTGEDAEGEPR